MDIKHLYRLTKWLRKKTKKQEKIGYLSKKDKINVLPGEIEGNKDLIFNRFKRHNTNKEKQNIWKDMLQTNCNRVQRSGKEVREKYPIHGWFSCTSASH